MQITLNGKKKNLNPSQNLDDIIREFCKNTPRIIAEVNGSIIKKLEWNKTILKDGDCVELVSFVGGG